MSALLSEFFIVQVQAGPKNLSALRNSEMFTIGGILRFMAFQQGPHQVAT